jgi:phosphate transport system substrate-binding protein
MKKPISTTVSGLAIAGLVVFASTLSAAGPRAAAVPATVAPRTLVIPGTGDSQDALRHLAAAYEKAHPDVRIVIPDSTGSFATKPGTLGGLESAGTRTTELGRTAVRPREIDLKEFGPMYYREFARVPVAFVVHSSVSVRAITSQDLCAVYAGQIGNWNQLGGPDLPLVVQTRPEGSNMMAIRQAIACFRDLTVTPRGHFNLRNADAVTSMREIPGSIGFMPLSEAERHGFDVLHLDGRAPASGGYPVNVSLGLVHMDPLSGLAKDFVDFLATTHAAEILRESGHVPVQGASEAVALPR